MEAAQVRYRIEVHQGILGVDGGAWDELVGEQSPFLEYGFLSLLEEAGCVGERAGWYPMIFTATREGDDEALAGALPLYLKTNSEGEFVFDWSWADAAYRAGISYYPKGVVAVPFTPVTGRRVLLSSALSAEEAAALGDALIGAARQFARDTELSSLHFNFVTEPELELFERAELPLRYGMQYHWYNGRERGEAGPYEDFADFLARFRSKRRANIRRERRKVAEAGVTTRVVRGGEVDEALMARMFDYYVDTINKFFYGRQYLTRDFFLALPERLGERLHLVIASRDGEDFAGALNLYKDRRLYGRYWGCVEEVKYTHFEVCMYAPIEWCIEHGVEVFEPGAGGEHKYERGFEPTTTYSAHDIVDPRLRAAIEGFLAQERRERERQIEVLSADNPFKD